MIAEVIVDVMSSEVDRVFDYQVPDTFSKLTIGYRVKVPFGNRQIEGYVVKLKDATDCPIDKLKSITAILDDYPLIKPDLTCDGTASLIPSSKRKYNLSFI